ncbi:MAG: D-tyrosyl-tRNA(Tyr) deacylase [Parcubacteria group bacterium]|nr:D-tyrosyl-tRNA(Tyr) deacylase [Parcubacteria group bacterium]
MRAVLQRVSSSNVSVGGKIIGSIGRGLTILLGVGADDEESVVPKFVEKIANLRIFQDDSGKMNRSLLDSKGEILLISQFTLYGDARKGRRPSFIGAADPEKGRALYEKVIDAIRGYSIRVETGEFGGYMDVEIHNDGPTTIILDSNEI